MMLPIKGQVFGYDAFLALMKTLVSDGKTTGNNPSEKYIGFTALNKQRMERLEKTIILKPELEQIAGSILQKQNWYVITEAWCGDSAQNLPWLAAVSRASQGKITLQIILRDENPDWITKYHTQGTHAIPKLISFAADGKELFIWGPRPKPAMQMLYKWKAANPPVPKEHFEVELHTWHARDKGMHLQSEFETMLLPYTQAVNA